MTLRAITLGMTTNTALVKVLETGSETLQDISEVFGIVAADMKIFTFIETEFMTGFGLVVSPFFCSRVYRGLDSVTFTYV